MFKAFMPSRLGRYMLSTRSLFSVVFAGLITVLIIFQLGRLLGIGTSPLGVVNLQGGWQRNMDGTWQDTNMLRLGTSLNEPISLRYDLSLLPERTEEEAMVLMYKANFQWFTITLDGEALYSNHGLAGKDPGIEVYYVSLPADYAKHFLYVDMVSPYRFFSGSLPHMFIGSTTDILTFVFLDFLPKVLLSTLSVLCSVVIAVLYVLQLRNKTDNTADIWFSLFAFVWGIAIISGQYIFCRLMTPAGASTLTYGLYYFLPLLFAVYFYYSLSDYRKYMFPPLLMIGYFVASALLLKMVAGVEPPELLSVFAGVMVVAVFAVAIIGALEAAKGNGNIRSIAPFLMCSFLFGVLDLLRLYNTGNTPWYFMLSVTVMACAVLIRAIRRYWSSTKQAAIDVEALRLRSVLADENFAAIQERIEERKKLDHELKNHVKIMEIMVSDGHYDELKSYLGTYTGTEAFKQPLLFTKNHVVNAILNDRLRKAAAEGITTTHEIRTPQHLPFNDTDVCSMLMNILDNAIESCLRLSEPEKRWLRLVMDIRQENLFLQCDNSRGNEIERDGNAIRSSKRNPSQHGIGLRVVKDIAKKYGGTEQINYDEECFSICLALPLK